MDSNSAEILHDFSPFIRIYKDGRVERIGDGEEVIPPGTDPKTGVKSKDVIISPETGVYVRLFLPKITNPTPKKLPLLIYIHGGAFCNETPSSPLYHTHLNYLASKANIIGVSIHYRRAPEHPLPIVYEDSWAALKWVWAHVKGDGPEPWLNDYADFERVFLGGDSAGANIANHMVVRAGADHSDGQEIARMKIVGLILLHPFFCYCETDKMIQYFFPSNGSGCSDPRLNPGAELAELGCGRVMVCVAEKDWLKGRGVSYYEALKKSGWRGVAEFVETEGEDHVFHLFNPDCDKADELLEKVAAFINQD